MSSSASPPHMPQEDGLTHPAHTSRPNLAAALGVFSRTCTLQVVPQPPWMIVAGSTDRGAGAARASSATAAGRARRAEGAGGGGGGQADGAQTHAGACRPHHRPAERDGAAPPAGHAVRRRVCLRRCVEHHVRTAFGMEAELDAFIHPGRGAQYTARRALALACAGWGSGAHTGAGGGGVKTAFRI